MADVNPILEVYKASAGSGKTYQLAYKYICLLLGERTDADGHLRLYTHKERRMHREILAITFTNKATEEMKQRIIKELFLLSDPQLPSNYRSRLMKCAGVSDIRLAQAAREALTSLLFDFGGMQVSTIDAFFQRILRSFAYEADLSGNYELMLDNKLMIQMAIADTLAMVCGMRGTTAYDRRHIKHIRGWIGEMLDFRVENAEEIKIFDKNSSIRAELVRFIEDLSDESYQAKSKQIDDFFKNEENIDSLIAALRERKNTLSDEIAAIASGVIAGATEAVFTKNALTMLQRISQTKFSELTSTNLAYVKGERNDYEKFFRSKMQYPIGLLGELERMFALLKTLRTVDIMSKQMFNLGLFHEVLQVSHRMKVHLNTIMLSDTNTLLNSIISGSDTPFIYERTGQRLHNFLIDEFQDTSKLQWLNLHPLVTNSLGNGFDNMIIGDVKQCIYRFRNSYPGLLDTELEADDYLRQAISLPTMDTNWRSAGEIVDFNSFLFDGIASRLGISSYATVRQLPRPSAHKGYVNVAVVPEFPDAAFSRMVSHIRRQLDSGYLPKDIVVLVRFNKEAGRVVERLLAESAPGGVLEGVRVLSDEALYVRTSKAVQHIISKLRELDRIQRDPANIPVSPRSGLPKTTDRELDWLRETLERINSAGTPGDASLEELLKQFDSRNHLAARTPEEDAAWRARTRGRSVFEIVEELISQLPDPHWRVADAQFLTAFQDLVVEYCRMNAPSVHGFLALWDDKLEKSAAVGLAEGTNAIRVLTIHKSKGLEFECVHVPLLSGAMDAERGYGWYDAREIFRNLDLGCEVPPYFPLNSSSALTSTDFASQFEAMQSEQFLDELNILYVAFTRARTELIATAMNGRQSAAQLMHGVLSAAGNSLDEKEWEYEYGSPTVNDALASVASATDIKSVNVSEYHVYDRLDTWHNTRPAEQNDSGELI